MAIFVSLQTSKDHAEDHRNGKTLDQVFTVVFMNKSMVRPSHSTARQQQDQRIDEGQMPRIESLNPCGRPDTIDPRAALGHRIKAVFKEGPKYADEKHRLRGEEKEEAHTQADLHHWRMIACLVFFDRIGPPAEHRI